MVGFDDSRRAARDAGAGAGELLPTWDLDPIYPGFDSDQYTGAKHRLATLSAKLTAHLSSPPLDGFAAWLKLALELEDESGQIGRAHV